MSKEIAVKGIILRIGKQEITLTPDEARALLHELEMVLKGSTVYVSSPWIVTYPETKPTCPQITWTSGGSVTVPSVFDVEMAAWERASDEDMARFESLP